MDAKDVLIFAEENKVEIVDLKFMDFPDSWQHFSFIARCEMWASTLSQGSGSLY